MPPAGSSGPDGRVDGVLRDLAAGAVKFVTAACQPYWMQYTLKEIFDWAGAPDGQSMIHSHFVRSLPGRKFETRDNPALAGRFA